MADEAKEKTPQEILDELKKKCWDEIAVVLTKYNMSLHIENTLTIKPK